MDVPEIRCLDDVRTLIRLVGANVGGDFDPYRAAGDYCGPDGRPRFSGAQAARLDTAIDAAEEVCEQAGVDFGELARRVVDDLRHGPWPSTGDLVVLLLGVPTDGLRCYGPFPTGDSVDAEHRALRGAPLRPASLGQLDLPPGQLLLHRVEVAMALLDDAAQVAAAADRPGLAGELTVTGWRLRALQHELS
jgi:hypothetical protein